MYIKKRTIKNIILTVVIILCLGSMYFTMNYIKNNVTNTNSSSNNMNMNNNQQAPSMPENNASTNERPELPDGNMPNNDGQTPPEKPDGENNNTNNSSDKNESNQTDSNTNNDNSQGPGENTQPGSNGTGQDNANNNNQPNGNGMNGNPPSMPNEVQTTTIPTIYYLIFGIESLILAVTITYLVMSNFNKKNIKETFTNKDKVTIAILSVIVLTSALTYTLSLLTKNYFLNNTNTTNQPGNNPTQASYSAKTEITKDETISSGTYESTTKDENAISVSGNITSTLSNITVTKTGDSEGGDNTSFYGTNSAIIAKDGANLTIKDATIETNATGANGVFSYGGSATTNNSSNDGTTVTISDSKITTKKDNSGGIMTTGGGIMNANNLTINTAGTSSAAIRTDRGGGTVTVNKGTYTTTGQGSPTIYSTANVTVTDAKLISKASEGIVIEGKNSVTINSCELIDTNNKLNGQSTTYKNIFLYQSMSGDAATGQAEFTAKDSKITTNKGDSFYVTNTTAIINLENNTIKNTDSTGNFLRVQKDSWGTSGSNGGNVTLNMTKQKVKGNIVIDSISTLTMNMKSSSSLEGAINTDNTAKSITLKLDKSSKIKLTADSYVTSLDDEDEDYSNIDFNGYKLYVNGKAIN